MSKHFRLPLLLALLLAFTFTTTTRAEKADKAEKKSHSVTADDATLNKLLEAHNKERKDDGDAPLTMNSKLTAAAQAYAEYLAKSGKFSHEADGTPGSRVKAQGYHYHAVGENIAEGQTSVEKVLKDWMNSKGHRENILRKSFKEVGFGIAKTDKGRTVWVVDFGAK